MDEVPKNRRSQLENSEVVIRFTDAHLGCPYSFILEGYTVELLKKLYPFTKKERKEGVERFQVWYKLEAFPPLEPHWTRLENDELLPNTAIVREWRMVDPEIKNEAKVSKIKLVR